MKPVEIEFLMKDRLTGGLDNARVKADLLDASLKRAALAAGSVFTVQKALEFGRAMMDVRGQIESFQISFDTLLGDKGKAAAFFGELKEFAVNTPLMLDDLARSAQTMLGFGVEGERVMTILKQIGDVTMGNSERLKSMSLAFSQMWANGRLMGDDLLQMIDAGFNPLTVMAERTGKSVRQLREEMSAGAISAEMVAQAFADATGEGGKYYQMLEKQSKGVKGLESNFQGAVQDMLNELGSKTQDWYAGGIEAATELVKNYEEVGNALMTVVAALGSYKAMVLATVTVQKLLGLAENIRLVMMFRKELGLLKAAQQAFNITAMANPYILLGSALLTVAAAVAVYSRSCSAAADEAERLNAREKEQSATLDEKKRKVEECISAIQDENATSEEKREKLNELKALMPSVFRQYQTEKELIDGLSEARRAYNAELREEKVLKSKENLKDDRQRVADLKEYLKLRQEYYKYGRIRMSDTDFSRYTELDVKYKPEVRKSRGTFQPYNDALAEMIKASEASLSKDTEAVRRNEQNRWEAMTGTMTADAAEAMAASYGNLLKIAKDSGKKWVEVQGESVPVSTDVLEQRIRVLKGRVKTVRENAAKDFLKEAKTDWEDAQKGVKAVIASRNDREQYPDEASYQTALEKARQKEEEAKKRYERLGGKTGRDATKETDEANRLETEQAARTRKIQEYTRNVSAQMRESELEIRAAHVASMEEGAVKEKEAIALHYDQLIEENRKRRERWVKELQEKANLEFENEHPDYKKKGLALPAVTEADLSAEQQAMLKRYEDEAADYKRASQARLVNDLLAEYRNYAQQRREINRQFDEQKLVISGSDVQEGVKNAALTELEKKRQAALKSVNDAELSEMQQTSSLLVELFGDASGKSVSEINRITAAVREMLDYLATTKAEDITPKFGFTAEQLKTLKSSPKELEAIQKAVEELYDAGVRKNPFASLAKDLKALFSAGGEDKDMAEKLADIGESAAASAEMIGSLAGQLSGMFEAMGNTSMADAMDTVQGVMSSISNIGQGFAKGGIIGGIASAVGEAVGWITKAFQANARHRQALKEIMNETIAQQRAYNLLLMEQNLEYRKGTTIFGVDQYGKAANAVKVMKKAYEELNATLVGTESQQSAFAYKQFGNRFLNDIFNRSYSVQKDAYSGLADIEIKTGHKKTGLFGWGKGKDIYSSVLDVYPELIDANGQFNASLAETIVSTREMSEEDKAALQHMIDLTRQAEEAWEEVRGYFEGIFGDLGNTLSSVLVDAFRNGTDAAKGFSDAVAGMLEDLAEQMIYTVTLAPYLEKAQNDMLDIMKRDDLTDEEKFDNYVRILDQMTDGVLGNQDYYNSLLEKYKEMAADKGLDLWENDGATQTGKSGAYEITASQESVTRLEGLYTSMLEYIISTDGNVENLVQCMNTALERLKKIEENTGKSSSHLEKMEKALDNIKNDISAIKRDGVRTK